MYHANNHFSYVNIKTKYFEMKPIEIFMFSIV